MAEKYSTLTLDDVKKTVQEVFFGKPDEGRGVDFAMGKGLFSQLGDVSVPKDPLVDYYFDVVEGILHERRLPVGSPILRIASAYYRNFPIDKGVTVITIQLLPEQKLWHLTASPQDIFLPVSDELWEDCLVVQSIKNLTR